MEISSNSLFSFSRISQGSFIADFFDEMQPLVVYSVNKNSIYLISFGTGWS